ncbi:MAG: cytochrome c biogenesis protein ResB [Verrucomicrobia bacterium]|nr:cytochrome c biogenesis protein ResB [Verrucomicrobiota bacterium]
MKSPVRQLRDFFVSLRLTVVLLVLGMILVFVATLDQVNLGIWAVQEKYFRSFFVVGRLPGLDVFVPFFPGGYLIGGLLLINLIASHFFRFKFTWNKAGIQLTHAGLIFLLLGELFTGLYQDDFSMRLTQGEPRNYSESYRENELAIIDTTDAAFDDVVAIPESVVARKAALQHPKLPFRIVPKEYYPNSGLRSREGDKAAASAGGGPRATQGIGLNVDLLPQAVTYKHDERNVPGALVELVGSDGPIGTWVVSSDPRMPPQRFQYAGRSYTIGLRFTRHYKPFTLTLLKFSHDRYAGTEIPKNFSSRIRLNTPDGRDDREVLIYMNNPMRYSGLTFYQASFEPGNDKVTILQVVRNPSWLVPYIACSIMTLGLIWQFAIHLTGFIARRRAAPEPRPA